jgi:hypothetical protein
METYLSGAWTADEAKFTESTDGIPPSDAGAERKKENGRAMNDAAILRWWFNGSATSSQRR